MSWKIITVVVSLVCISILIMAYCGASDIGKLHEGVLVSAEFEKPGILGEARWYLKFEDGTEIVWIHAGSRMWKIGQVYEVYGINANQIKDVKIKE